MEMLGNRDVIISEKIPPSDIILELHLCFAFVEFLLLSESQKLFQNLSLLFHLIGISGNENQHRALQSHKKSIRGGGYFDHSGAFRVVVVNQFGTALLMDFLFSVDLLLRHFREKTQIASTLL